MLDVRAPHRGTLDGRARDRRRRTASSPGGTRSTRSTTSGSRSGSPTTCSMEYGTGAIMAVPAHDERDFAFAERYGLEIRQVVAPGGRLARRAAVRREVGRLAGSSTPGEFTGLPTPEAITAIVAWLEEPGRGEATIGYRLRDWLLSRQRYWGCPIPIVYCDACGMVPVPDEELPGRAAARSRTTCRRAARRSPPPRTGSPRPARRAAARRGARRTRWTRSSTRPGTSSATPTRATTRRRSTATIVDYWLPVNQYIGGIEHAILHLLYARFFAKVLNDLGLRRVPRAVRAALHAGDDLPPRREDVEVEGQRRLARTRRSSATAPTRCGSTSSSWARPRTTRSGRTRASRGSSRFLDRHLAARARGRGARRRSACRTTAPLVREGARDDRQGHRRHRRAASSSTRRSRP